VAIATNKRMHNRLVSVTGPIEDNTSILRHIFQTSRHRTCSATSLSLPPSSSPCGHRVFRFFSQTIGPGVSLRLVNVDVGLFAKRGNCSHLQIRWLGDDEGLRPHCATSDSKPLSIGHPFRQAGAFFATRTGSH